jgi:glycosyltransferase involved in cell wall biosynthesis
MNIDALRVLAHASELLPPDVELVFCTGASASMLTQAGITSSRLRVMWLPPDRVREFQSSAHVLIAPLSHKNCASDEVRTVFSTKLLEYLISGRPIVVFAPPDSFHALSATRGKWGYVVDENNPHALAKGIMKVMQDEELAGGLVSGALREAERRASAIHAQRLYEWIGKDMQLGHKTLSPLV